ncbi:hypothetical protein ACFL0O_09925, partial [Thermodesulfobacteriota bacterium]
MLRQCISTKSVDIRRHVQGTDYDNVPKGHTATNGVVKQNAAATRRQRQVLREIYAFTVQRARKRDVTDTGSRRHRYRMVVRQRHWRGKTNVGVVRRNITRCLNNTRSTLRKRTIKTHVRIGRYVQRPVQIDAH